MTASAVHKQAAVGRLHRVHRGVYSLAPPELLSRKGRFLAAVLACGRGAVLSHRSAAALLGLRTTDRAVVEVSVSGKVARRHPGIEVHRTTTLTAADVTTVDGIPCTTIARTLLDLAAVVPKRQLERALEQAEALERLDAAALTDQLTRHPSKAGANQLRQLLNQRRGAPTESELEERFLALLRQANLPEPERQIYVDPGDGGPMVRADFLWRSHRLIVETDGARYHNTRRAFHSDRHRDQRLLRAGWRVVRITWQQLRDDPGFVVALLQELFRRL